ncbi:MAG: isocitrate lyase/phosphoenolpyruvate mutase family protein [Pseudomonadota bacterium]
MTQADKITRFRALHRPGDPLVLVNVWDVGSANAVAEAGAPALATASWACAASRGFKDDQSLPLDEALINARRIVEAVELAVSLDFESGYASDHDGVAENVQRASQTGIAGVNLEDRLPGADQPLALDQAVARVRAARAAAPIFINARLDVFLANDKDRHEDLLDQAIARARAFVDAGADGVFVPGLSDRGMLARVCAACPAPVNAMAYDPVADRAMLAEAGVARISSGPGPYRAVMAALTERAQGVYASDR